MKKILSLILLVVMVFTFTACGEDVVEDPTAPPATEEPKATEEPASVFPEALASVVAYEIDIASLKDSGWELAGGMIEGVEMEQEDLNNVLAGCGGSMYFLFPEDNKVQLIMGTETFDGEYTLTNEGCALNIKIPGYEYYAVFSIVNELEVLIIANVTDPTSALYMTLMQG